MSCLEEYLNSSSGSDIPSEGITTASFLDKNSKEEIKFYKVKNNNKTTKFKDMSETGFGSEVLAKIKSKKVIKKVQKIAAESRTIINKPYYIISH